MIVAKITINAAFDVANFLDRMIPTYCPLKSVKEWKEVRDALYALANDTDAIVTDYEIETTCPVCRRKLRTERLNKGEEQ